MNSNIEICTKKRFWTKIKNHVYDLYTRKMNHIIRSNTIFLENNVIYRVTEDDPYVDIKRMSMLFRIDEKTGEITSRLATQKCFYKYLRSYLNCNNREISTSAKNIWLAMIYNSFSTNEKSYLHFYCITNDDGLMESIEFFRKKSSDFSIYLKMFYKSIYTERFFINSCVIKQIFDNSLADSK